MKNAILRGKNPHVRIDEEVAASAKTSRARLYVRSCALGLGVMAGASVGLPASAATTIVASPARAIVSYASESKGVVNVRGLSSARDNARSMRLKGRGAVLIIR